MKKLIDKRIFTVVSIVLGIGFAFGIVFLICTSSFDKILIKTEISEYFSLIKDGKILTFSTFLNSFKTNFIYIFLITMFSIVYFISPLILFLNFYKGMVLGFYSASIILVFKAKGILIVLTTLLSHHLIVILTLIIYSSIMLRFSLNLLKCTREGENLNLKLFIKRVVILFLLALIVCIISSILELFLSTFILSLIM